MPGLWTSSRVASVSTSARRVRADQQDLGHLAVDELLEQAGGIAGQAARREDVDVSVGGLLDPQDQLFTGSGQNDAAHRGTPT